MEKMDKRTLAVASGYLLGKIVGFVITSVVMTYIGLTILQMTGVF
jgi:hypothetical protein